MASRTRRLKSSMAVHKSFSKSKSAGQADFGLGLWHRRTKQSKGSTDRVKAADTLRYARKGQ